MKTKTTIGKEAYEAFENNDFYGTVCMKMGSGKTKLGLDLISNREDIYRALVIVPLNEVANTWKSEMLKWWGPPSVKEPLTYVMVSGRRVRIDIMTMQSAYKFPDMGYDAIIVDEIHTLATPVYGETLAIQTFKYLLGLTGTPDLENEFKAKFYRDFCPIIYRYEDSEKDGLINQTRYYIHTYPLTDWFKAQYVINGGVYTVGENARYEKLEKDFKQAGLELEALGAINAFSAAKVWINSKYPDFRNAGWKYMKAMSRRKEFLLTLKSGEILTKYVLNFILKLNPKYKVVIFSELIEKSEAIAGKNSVHSKKPKEICQEIIRNFNKGDIRAIGSAYALNLGINLVGATHAIMHTFVGSKTTFEQRKGRTSRLDPSEISEVHVILPKNTQAVAWFEKAAGRIPKQSITYVDYTVEDMKELYRLHC